MSEAPREIEHRLAVARDDRDPVAATRALLVTAEIATLPRAWAQLAYLALVAGRLDEAADAAAEGLARSGDDDVLHELLDRARGQLPDAIAERRWSPHADGAVVLAFAGAQLVSAGRDRELHVWDVASGKRVRSLYADHAIHCVDARHGRVAIGTAGGEIVVWELATGRRLARFETEAAQTAEQEIAATQLAFGLAYGGGPPDEATLARLEPAKLPIRSVALDDRGDVVSAGDDRTVRWWSVERGQCTARIPCDARGLAIHGGATIARTSHAGAGTSDAIPSHAIAGGTAAMGRTLGTSSAMELARASDATAYTIVAARDQLERWANGQRDVIAPVAASALCATAYAVIAGCVDGNLHVYGDDGRAHTIAGISALQLVAGDGDTFAALDRGGCVRWWRGDVRGLAVHDGGTGLAVAPDGRVVSAASDGSVAIWAATKR